MEPVPTAHWTWRAMYGNGARIGTIRGTGRVNVGQTQQGQPLVSAVCCVAVRGTATSATGISALLVVGILRLNINTIMMGFVARSGRDAIPGNLPRRKRRPSPDGNIQLLCEVCNLAQGNRIQ